MLLLLLTSQAGTSTRVLVPHFIQANRTRPNSVEKQRKASLFDQRMESYESTLSDRSAGAAVNKQGTEFSQTEGGCRHGSPSRGLCQVHCLCTEPLCQEQSLGTRSTSLKCWVQGLSCGQPSMSCENRLSIKGEKKWVRLSYPDSVFVFWGLFVAFAGDKPLLGLLSCTSFLRGTGCPLQLLPLECVLP